MVFNNSILLGAAGQGGVAPFDTTLIGNSVWFNGTDSRMDSPSFSAQSDPTCFTFATWVQILDFSISPAGQYLWSAERTGNYASIRIDNNNKLVAYSNPASFTSDMIFRDTGWYHIICSYKGSANTVRMFVNGVEITNSRTNSLATNPEPVAFSHTQRIGAYYVGATGGDLYEANSYMAQTVFLDGFSFQDGDITVSDFLDTFTFGTNGSQFIPKKDSELATLAGTAGANSYVLDYADSSNLGNDISANNNDFTVNSMSSVNQSINTPSKYYPKVSNIGTPSGDTAANYTMGKGSNRMVYSGANQTYKGLISTQLIQSDDSPIYWEYYLESGSVGGASGGRVSVGLCVPHFNAGNASGFSGAGGNNPSNLRGVIYDNGDQGATTGSTLIGVGDIQNLAYEPSTGKIWFGVNGTWNNGSEAASTTLNPSGHDYQATVQDYVFFISAARSTDIGVLNFGDNPSMSGNITAGTETDANGHGLFKYAVPSGFFAPVSANLTAPRYQGIDYFNATLYEGNGTAIGSGGKSVTGVGFKPDFTWIKNRDAADSHILTDVVRGVTKYISSNSTAAEATNTESLSTFDTDGFTVGNLDAVNTNTENYVSWNWLAGGTGSSNTNGSINSTVTVAGAGHLSIGTYVGSGANATIGHGLGGAPEMIIVKNRDQTDDWPVYHVGTASDPETDVLYLNLTSAVQDSPFFWNDTAPTTSVFSIGTGAAVNTLNENYVFYTFRSVPGVCKVGSYVGNNTDDNAYISLGFKPRFFMCKKITGASQWHLIDSARSPINEGQIQSFANLANAEQNSTVGAYDLLSDGIKIRSDAGFEPGSTGTWLYMAMADIGGNGTLPPIYGR